MLTHLPNTKTTRFLLTCAVALLGAFLFAAIHAPVPWLIGPMTAALLGAKGAKLPLAWPGSLRDAGNVMVGYTIGLSLTNEALKEIGHQVPSMLIMTAILIGLCTVSAAILSRLARIDFPTMMTASIPGGLTQILALAEETEGIDLTVVTFFQVIRVIMIVFCVPLLLFSPLFGGGHASAAAGASSNPGWGQLFPFIFIYAAVCLLSAWAGKRVKLPTAYMLGPIIGTAIVHLSGVYGPSLPSPLLHLSQFFIGVYVGLLLQPGQLKNKSRTIFMSLFGGVILVAGSLGFSWFLSRLHSISYSTSFLSLAPGGMDQMSIIAHEVGADVSIVSGYQTFRLLFIYFVVSAALKWYLQGVSRRRKGAASGLPEK